MRMLRHPERSPFARSLLAALVVSVIALSPLVLLTVLSGCSSGSDGENPPPDDGTNEPIKCPCLADVYIDEWKPEENMNGETRLLLATNTNIHHGIARGLLLFDIPETLTAAQVQEAKIFFSACSHCNAGGYGGRVGFYTLDGIHFDENTSTWYSLGASEWEDEWEHWNDAVHTEVDIPAGTDWNEAVNGEPPADAVGFDITLLLQNDLELEKMKEYGILMRFVDEHQDPYTHQNVASRESTDIRDFAPFVAISIQE